MTILKFEKTDEFYDKNKDDKTLFEFYKYEQRFKNKNAEDYFSFDSIFFDENIIINNFELSDYFRRIREYIIYQEEKNLSIFQEKIRDLELVIENQKKDILNLNHRLKYIEDVDYRKECIKQSVEKELKEITKGLKK